MCIHLGAEARKQLAEAFAKLREGKATVGEVNRLESKLYDEEYARIKNATRIDELTGLYQPAEPALPDWQAIAAKSDPGDEDDPDMPDDDDEDETEDEEETEDLAA